MISPAAEGLGVQFFSISDQVALHGQFRATDPAFVQGDDIIDWQTFNERANQIASGLVAAGVQRGDRVAMLYGCETAAFELIMGIWRAGAAFVPLSPLLTPDLSASLANDSGAKLLFSNQNYEGLAAEAAELGGLRHISVGASFEAFLSDSGAVPTIRLDQDDLANIIYSSGTTGKPKGITHTHGARFNMSLMISSFTRFYPQSRAYLAIPPHSNGALLMWGPAMVNGAVTVLQGSFDVEGLFDIVKQWRPTHGFLVPTMCQGIINHPNAAQAGLECFECAITAGAPMPLAMKQTMQELTQGGLAELWGLTESVATYMSPEEMATRPESVGRPATCVDLRIINDNDEDVTARGVGEIVGRSTSLMNGYWNRPDTNKDIIWTSAEGVPYIRTGDIGEFDEDGYLTLRGRAKDMIISGGLNVFPVDIEAELLNHEDVHDASVIGVADEKWGEVPVAFVIAKPDAQIDTAGLTDWVNRRLAKHQRIHDMDIWHGDFPRNTLGKVLKNDLVAAYADAKN